MEIYKLFAFTGIQEMTKKPANPEDAVMKPICAIIIVVFVFVCIYFAVRDHSK